VSGEYNIAIQNSLFRTALEKNKNEIIIFTDNAIYSINVKKNVIENIHKDENYGNSLQANMIYYKKKLYFLNLYNAKELKEYDSEKIILLNNNIIL